MGSQRDIQISRYNKELPAAVMSDVIRIKNQHHVSSPQEASKNSNGFLVGTLDHNTITVFLKNHGTLYVAYLENNLIAYALLTPIEEFFSYFSPNHKKDADKDEELATFTPSHLRTNILQEIKTDLFFYQIAVAQNFARTGAASALMKRIFADFPNQALVADILVEPALNQSSLSFFEKHGFKQIGTLDYPNYKSFGDLKTKVLRRTS